MPRLALLWLAGCAAEEPAVPKPDVCDLAEEASVDRIEIGGPDGDFEPWDDGEVVDRTWGGQGSEMIGLRHRFEGGAVAPCLAQATALVRVGGGILAQEERPLRTYQAPDGSRMTRPLWLILDSLAMEAPPMLGEPLTARVTAAGRTLEVDLKFECDECPVPRLSWLAPLDPTLVAGQSIAVRVGLSGEPPWGTAISLASSDPEIAAPTQESIPLDGVGAPEFTVRGQRAGGPVLITATLGDSRVSVEMTVTE